MRKLFSLLLSLAIVHPSWAAITHNSTSESSATSGVSSLTYSHTIASGSNTVLFVGTTARDATPGNRPVTSVTFNGLALTKIREDVTGDNTVTTGMWYRVSPDVTTANIVVTYTGTVATAVYSAAEAVDGADSTAIEAQNGANSTVSGPVTVDVVSLTDGAWALDMAYSSQDTVFTIGAGQTERQSAIGFAAAIENAGMSTEPKATAGTITMSWTIGTMSTDRWVTTAVVIKPSSGAAAATVCPSMNLLGVGCSQ